MMTNAERAIGSKGWYPSNYEQCSYSFEAVRLVHAYSVSPHDGLGFSTLNAPFWWAAARAGWSSGFALPTPPFAHGGQTEVVLRRPTGERAVVSVSAQLTTSVAVVVTLRETSSHPSLCIDNRTFMDLRACQVSET